MRALPEKLLESLEGVTGFDKKAFVKVHEEPQQITSIRINPAKIKGVDLSFNKAAPAPWSQYGFYLDRRPSFTFDPLFHAGVYYVQEASSMFLEQVFLQFTDTNAALKVLDLCAAPGGKSTHIQSLISSDSLLVSNEVIKSRCHILMDNIIKWGSQNVIVTNNDPSAFSRTGEYFDVIVVDAPCSGSGLFRRDEEAIEEWSINNVQLCCQRQQRILAAVLPSLKENGLLVYSTCSFSREEDEDIMDWLVKEMEMQTITIETDPAWNIVSTVSAGTSSVGYRFFPDKLKGEGLFLACFRKTGISGMSKIRPAKIERLTSKDRSIVAPWLKEFHGEIIKERENIYALQQSMVDDFTTLKTNLNIQYAGIGLGQIMKERLVPAHSLAMSTIVSDNVPSNELDLEKAIKYLQRQEFLFEYSDRGWQLVRFKGQNLGWVNVLQNRINNYYPKELRILKQQNDGTF